MSVTAAVLIGTGIASLNYEANKSNSVPEMVAKYQSAMDHRYDESLPELSIDIVNLVAAEDVNFALVKHPFKKGEVITLFNSTVSQNEQFINRAIFNHANSKETMAYTSHAQLSDRVQGLLDVKALNYENSFIQYNPYQVDMFYEQFIARHEVTLSQVRLWAAYHEASHTFAGKEHLSASIQLEEAASDLAALIRIFQEDSVDALFSAVYELRAKDSNSDIEHSGSYIAIKLLKDSIDRYPLAINQIPKSEIVPVALGIAKVALDYDVKKGFAELLYGHVDTSRYDKKQWSTMLHESNVNSTIESLSHQQDHQIANFPPNVIGLEKVKDLLEQAGYAVNNEELRSLFAENDEQVKQRTGELGVDKRWLG